MPLIAYVTVSIAWGTTYGGIKVAVETMPPFTMAATRFIVAGVLMIWAFRLAGFALPARRDLWRLAGVGFLLLTCANGLLSFAEQHVSSAFAALMVNTAPFLFVGLSAWAGERVPAIAWAGLIIGFGGVLVLVSPQLRDALGPSPAVVPPAYWWSVLALVIGPSCWAVGSFLGKRHPVGCHPLMGAAFQTLFGGCGALVISLLVGEYRTMGVPSGRSLAAVGYLIVVGSLLGYVAYNYCVIHLAPQRTATTTYLNMLVAIGVGALFLGETISPAMIVGGAVILFGVFLVNSARQLDRLSGVYQRLRGRG
jgi:drug/metabolite transporter (DMT)-like permease